MKDYRIERRKILDGLLDKMEKALQDNTLVMNQLSASMADAKKYRDSGPFFRPLGTLEIRMEENGNLE